MAEFRANTLVEISLTSVDADPSNLPDAQATALFHICQEALANIAKHARAKNVQISLWSTEDRMLMEIIDDGNGFNMEKMNINIGHGLSNMHTRAHAVGGEVDVSSVLNEGSTILVWVPRQTQP
jgi:signal transduction histidine kinase